MSDKRPYVVGLSHTKRTRHAWREGNKNLVCGLLFLEVEAVHSGPGCVVKDGGFVQAFKVDAEGNCAMCNRIVRLRRNMNGL